MTRIIRRALVAAAIGGLALAAVASAYTLDSFSGKTSQGYKVLLNIYEGIRNKNHKLVPDHVSVMQFHVNFTGKNPMCAADYKNQSTTIRPYYPAIIKLPHNRLDIAKFAITKRPGDDVYNLHAQLRSKTISGSFMEKFTNPASQLSCTTGKVTFSAKRH